jgi:hypothetical protein
MTIRRIFIASEVRSGSTIFAETLAYSLHASYTVQFWDLAKEHFNSINDFSNYQDILDIDDKLWANEWKCKVSKIMCASLSVITREARNNAEIAQRFFGNDTIWIVLKRRDVLAQAISLAYARKSGIYHAYDANAVDDGVGEVSNAEIMDSLRAINLSTLYLDNYFSQYEKSISLYYEDFLDKKGETLTELLTKLALPCDPGQLELAEGKLIPTQSADKEESYTRFKEFFVENYHEVLTVVDTFDAEVQANFAPELPDLHLEQSSDWDGV